MKIKIWNLKLKFGSWKLEVVIGSWIHGSYLGIQVMVDKRILPKFIKLKIGEGKTTTKQVKGTTRGAFSARKVK